MAKKSPLKKPENVRYQQQVEASLERQKARLAAERANTLERTTRTAQPEQAPKAAAPETAAPENTFNQTDTGEKRSRWERVKDRFRRTPAEGGGGKGTFNDPKRTSAGGNGPKTASGAPDLNRPKPKRFRRTRRLGTAGLVLGAADAFTNKYEGLQQDEYYDQYGGLAPRVHGADPDPIGATVEGALSLPGLFNSDYQTPEVDFNELLRKGVAGVSNFFTGDDKPSSEILGADIGAPSSFEATTRARIAGVEKATQRIAGEGASELDLRRVRSEVRQRAEQLTEQINSGTFNYDNLTEADKQLARDFGVKVPADTRTGIPEPTTTPELSRNPAEQDFANYAAEQGNTPPAAGSGDAARLDYYKYVRDNMGQEAADAFAQRTGTTPEEIASLDANNATPPVVGGNDATPPPVGGNNTTPPDLTRGNPTIYRKVGEDGVVEYSDTGGAGYEQVDLGGGTVGNTKGGFVAAQDNISAFPGTSAFVNSISKEANQRKREFRREQQRSRTMQARLPQRARAAVYAQNPDLVRAARKGGMAGGVASDALNRYTLEMAKVMQQGRDAFEAKDFDTTTPVIEADRNDVSMAGVDADLARTESYNRRNEIDAAGMLLDENDNILNRQRSNRQDSGKAFDDYMNYNFPETDENGVFNPDRGRMTAYMTELTDGSETPRQTKEIARQAHFLTEASNALGGVNVDPQQFFSQDFIDQILNNQVPGITSSKTRTWWEKIGSPIDATKAAFSSDELDSAIIKAGGVTLTLGQFLDLAHGYGRNRKQTTDLARNYTE